MAIRYVSTFSGIEAATLAAPCGWEPVCFSEIDDFPSAVLAHRFPEVPNLGDITKADWSKYSGAVDVLIGGSPCQSFSIAGNRLGLEGESGLMWEYVRAVQELRPKALLWENVPGALSSGKGEDFRCLLVALDALGYGLAWRVLDAQFFGVPQRRERVFLVGYLGEMGAERACEVLFERESLRWDTPSSKDKRKELAERIERGIGSRRSERTLAFDTTQVTSPQNGNNPKWDDPCHPLCAGGHPPTVVCRSELYEHHPQDSRVKGPLDTAPTVAKYYGTGGGNVPIVRNAYCLNPVMQSSIVRRITPRECERLQGFPDDWTKIPYKGKSADKCPDSPRYKALGNSMAVPVMRWIMGRMDAALKRA